MKKNVLFQIKDLEKLILRNLKVEENLKEALTKSCPTPTQMQIVGYILDNFDKDIYQKDLETVLDLRRATVSRVLQSMEKNGFIERVIEKSDTRTKKIILKPKAREMFLKNQEQLDKLEKIVIKDIPKNDLTNFLKVLNKMIQNIEKNECTTAK